MANFKRGKFLERIIEGIFKNAGFYTEVNTRKWGFETDVFEKKEGYNVIVQCKQHDKAYLNIKEKLFEWMGKGIYAKVDKVVLVVSGREIREDEYAKARELGVGLWSEDLVQQLLKLDKGDLKEKINRLIGFKEEEYQKKKEEEKEREIEEIRKEIFDRRKAEARVRKEKREKSILMRVWKFVKWVVKLVWD
ncbi:hypothetical protein LCGC14_2776010 [marine sediment metagenome]|uniref:Uncharacterized protein n=1 Tax=marine sediment metagenome TaxID=412755 RepID=A0A0F8YUP2_9ZZZZ